MIPLNTELRKKLRDYQEEIGLTETAIIRLALSEFFKNGLHRTNNIES